MMLSLFHHEAEASDLQQQFDNLLTLVEKSIPEIWPEEANEPETLLPVSMLRADSMNRIKTLIHF
jgi:hypothetical protein